MLRRARDGEQPQLIDFAARSQIVLQLSLGHAGLTLANDEALQAAVVQHCHPADLAARAGLRPGDVILSLNDIPVNSHEEAVALIERTAAASDNLLIEYMSASAAAEKKEESKTEIESRKRTQLKWMAANAIAIFLLFALVLWRGAREADEVAHLRKLSLHEKSGMLTDRLGGIARHSASLSPSVLQHLESDHPGALVKMLGHAVALSDLISATETDQVKDQMQAAIDAGVPAARANAEAIKDSMKAFDEAGKNNRTGAFGLTSD